MLFVFAVFSNRQYFFHIDFFRKHIYHTRFLQISITYILRNYFPVFTKVIRKDYFAHVSPFCQSRFENVDKILFFRQRS